MAMTKAEARGKVQIARKLAQQGYPTYAKIFDEFDLNITEDPEVIAYMEPGKGRIVVNKNLNLDAISVVIRHEILHQYLEHEKRLVRHVAKKLKMDPDKLDDMSIKKIKNLIYRGKEFNIAGDFEISNLGYTEADKRAIKSMVLNGEVVSGLVTEDHHPDWVDLPLEDMFDKLLPNNQQDQQNQGNQGEDQGGNEQGSDGSSGQGSGGSGKSKMSKKDFDDLNKSLESGDFDINDGDDPLRGNPGGTEIDQDTLDKLSDKAKKNLMDKLSKMGPQIGDKGNADIQAKEQEEREKNDVTGDQQNGQDDKDQSKKGKGSGQGKPDKDDQKDQSNQDSGQDGNQSGKDGQQSKKGGSTGGNSDDSKSNSRKPLGQGNGNLTRPDGTAQADGQGNIPERIRDILNDKSLASKLKGEVTKAVQKEKEDKVRREIDKYKKSGIYKFKLSLNNFLHDELDDERDYTWRRFNKTYAGSDLVKQGRATEDGPVPLINIYFDQSGSWDAAKIKVGEEAMGLIYKYKNEGKLRVKVYYFSNDVTDNRNDSRLNGGTEGQPIMDHIRQTHPNNVIIMTDSDIDDIRTDTTVPGAVWLLFKGGRSQNLIDHIRGKKETVVLDI